MREGFWLAFLLTSVLLALALGGIALFPAVDMRVSAFFSALQSEAGVGAMRALSLFGDPLLVLLASLAVIEVLALRRQYRALAFYALSVIGGALLSAVVKAWVQRPRPLPALDAGFAFPSGHALMAAALYGALAVILWPRYRSIAAALLAVPLLVGVSRISLSEHWLSDVVGGWFIGALWVMACATMLFLPTKERRRRRKNNYR